MAVKTQIKAAVDSAEFVEFKAAFDKYETALKGLPAVWAGVEKSTAKTRTNFEATAVSVGVLGSSIASVTARGKEFYQVTTATARHWKDLALSTHNVARNIIATTESLLKWGGVISLITGGAGLWGFDRLAGNVANQRSAAFGTGGERAGRLAFTTNFRRLGDPEGLLGRVAGMQADLKQSVPLRMLGISPDDIRNLPPEEVAMKALQRGAQIASTTRVPVGSDPRLAAFSTPERIWLRDHRAEIEGMIAETRREKTAGRFRLKPEEEKAAQDFETKMSKAGQAIETSFVKGLVKLAGPLGELSDSVVKLVASFTEKALPDIVKDLGEAIEWLAKEVDQPSFVSKVETFASMIVSLAGAFAGALGGLANFARWLGVDVPRFQTINQAEVQASSPSYGEKYERQSTGKGYGTHGAINNQFTGVSKDRGGTGAVGSPATMGQTTTAARGHDQAAVRDNEQGTISGTPQPPHRPVPPPADGETQTPTPPSRPSGGGSLPKAGWWTAARQAHAYNVLTKAGVSDQGARGLVSRWMNVEAPRGPASINPGRDHAFGIAQWLGPRKAGISGDTNFDHQLNYVVKELNNEGAPGAAGDSPGLLSSATTPREGARAASAYERAEHYDPVTHTDIGTNRTQRGMANVHTMEHGAARNRLFHRGQQISVNSVPGGNTSLSSGAAAAGSP